VSVFVKGEKIAEHIDQLNTRRSGFLSLRGIYLSELRIRKIEIKELPPRVEEPAVRQLVGSLLKPAVFGGKDSLVSTLVHANGTSIILISPDGKEPKYLTFGEMHDRSPSCSPDGKRIAFHSDRDGGGDIYVMDGDGGNVQRLTHGQGHNFGAAWSPDGRRIAFVTDRDGNREVYVMNADGSEQTNLTNHPGNDADPAWSPDGTKILFASQRDGAVWAVYVMDAHGGNVHKLLDASNSGAVYPAWSPDGKNIAYAGPSNDTLEIFVCKADGSQRKKLTTLGAVNSLAAWSPDGKRIAFAHLRSEDGTGSLNVMDVDGRNLIKILPASRGCRPSWQPLAAGR